MYLKDGHLSIHALRAGLQVARLDARPVDQQLPLTYPMICQMTPWLVFTRRKGDSGCRAVQTRKVPLTPTGTTSTD